MNGLVGMTSCMPQFVSGGRAACAALPRKNLSPITKPAPLISPIFNNCLLVISILIATSSFYFAPAYGREH
jgi:hypothetical protein